MSNYNPIDERLMKRALEESEKARFLSVPNPWVGCVIVREGRIIGQGHTQEPGKAHAEVDALAKCSESPEGATAYVTLEPCSHHGRTPPCCDALIRAKIARVVVAVVDPDLRVSGQGIQRLRDAGIDVELGIGGDAVRASLRAYLHQRSTGRPYTIMKSAVSIDGRTAAEDGTSQWITCPEARADVHRLRDECQAIMVGSGTALVDRPSLNIRHVERRSSVPPLRVLLDSRGRVPAEGPLFDSKIAPTLVFSSEEGARVRGGDWGAAGAEVFITPVDPEGGLCLMSVMQELGQRKIMQLMVEGGAFLHYKIFEKCLFDHLSVYLGPRLLGSNGRALLPWSGPETIAEAPQLKMINFKRLGDSVRMDYTFVKRGNK